jgi:hypothetical protein
MEERRHSDIVLHTLIAELEKRIELRFDLADKALAIQTEEFKRRLGDLNGEQARLAKDRERFLPREIHEASVKETAVWRERVEGFMSGIRGQARGVDRTWSAIIAVFSAIGAALGTWLTFKK